ncbi:MAG TPA: PQQ-binding-like beta-propeller repeat protein, partial [Chloroflexota bacterium]|nr:PQQ-binding-like beta-propeller repeat protein [Chloroflexota bacterium]
MHLSRRHFLEHLGQLAVLGGTGLIAACQGAQPPTITAVPPAAQPTSAPAKPAASPAASPVAGASPVASPSPVAGASPAPGASPVAKPSPSPGVAAAASPSPVAAGAVAGKPQYQMDAQHTGRSPHAGPRRLNLLRSFNTAANRPADGLLPSSDIQSSTSVGPDGTIYATNFAGQVFALRDGSTANQLDLAWQFHPPMGSPFHATPAVSPDGRTVYCPFTVGMGPGAKGQLFALRAPTSGQDGQVVWTAELGSGTVQNTPTLASDGTLYVVNVNGVLSAIDFNDGRVKWTAQVGTSGTAMFGQTVKVAPAVGSDGTVYVACLTGSLYAVTPPSGSGNQGTIKWAFDFGQHLGQKPLVAMPVTAGPNRGQDAIGSASSVTIGPDGTLYVGANNSNFYAIDANGQQKWLFEAERELAGIWTTACLSSDNSTLYFGANGGGIYALNSRDGSLKWQYPIYGSVYASSALGSSG